MALLGFLAVTMARLSLDLLGSQMQGYLADEHWLPSLAACLRLAKYRILTNNELGTRLGIDSRYLIR